MEAEMNYVYTVWKHRSFSKAARELYLTQPALSAAVKRVETKLGLPLFDRASKPLQLTEVPLAPKPEESHAKLRLTTKSCTLEIQDADCSVLDQVLRAILHAE